MSDVLALVQRGELRLAAHVLRVLIVCMRKHTEWFFFFSGGMNEGQRGLQRGQGYEAVVMTFPATAVCDCAQVTVERAGRGSYRKLNSGCRRQSSVVPLS